MKKNVIIIIMCIIIMLLALFMVENYSYAEDLGLGNLSNYKGNETDSTELNQRVGKILGYIQIIGSVISVVMLIVIGIKYMLGSVEEKAEYKQILKPYLIGAFLVFTGTLIPQIIYEFTKNF